MDPLSPVEVRIIGCMVEKQRTTPDTYPLSLNALRTACNQSTNRDPVVDYDEATLGEALRSLADRRWIRSSTGGRAVKYRHMLAGQLSLPDDQLALLAVLMLRGPQTPGELKQRAERLSPFADVAAVLTAMDELIARGLAEAVPRRPGQKEGRYRHLLGDEEREGAATTEGGVEAEPAAYPVADPPSELSSLKQEVRGLTERLEALERRLEDRV